MMYSFLDILPFYRLLLLSYNYVLFNVLVESRLDDLEGGLRSRTHVISTRSEN